MKQKMTKYVSFFIFLFMLMLPIKASAAVAAPEYTFTTLDGTTISTNGSGYQATVLVFGYTTCGTTGYELSDIAKSDWAKNPNIRVIFVDVAQNSKEEIIAFLEKYSCAGTTSCYDVTSWNLWDALKAYTEAYEGGNTMSVPTTVLVDGANNIQYLYRGAKSADDLIYAINTFVNTGYTTQNPYYNMNTNVTITGTEDYNAVNEVYQRVNQERAAKGLSALHLDKELTETAMQRAAEIAIYYSHMRPDGSECFSIFPNQNVCGAENIAIGYKNAESVMNGWLNSAGHYANIMDSDMKNIGIGCFVDDRGSCYWVQCFDGDTVYSETSNTNRIVSRTISVKSDFISLYAKEKETYKCNDTTASSEMIIRNLNSEYGYGLPALDNTSFKFASSNPSVAEVDENGIITLKGAGTAEITATLKGNVPLSVTTIIEKKDHQIVTTDKKSYCTSCNTIFWESASNDNNTNSNTNGNTNISGNGNTQTQVSLKKPKLKKVTAKKKSMAVSWNKVKNATGYEISYSLKSNFKSAKKVRIGKGSTTKKTIKKLKKNKRYYVRIRAYRSVTANGKTQKVYSAWSSKKRSGKIK